MTQAVEHFKQKSDDTRVVRIYSAGLQKWFQNSIGESSNFVTEEPLVLGQASKANSEIQG